MPSLLRASAFLLIFVGFAAPAQHAVARDDKVIDPSCLMVCVKWNGDTCEKFEQKCKGDPGYPSAAIKGNAGNAATMGNAGNAGDANNAGSAGNAGNLGKAGRTMKAQ
jgi:hypothetical protein